LLFILINYSIWTGAKAISVKNYINESLLDYIDNHNALSGDHKIDNVIDLLSESFYQNIFKWEKLYNGLNKRKIRCMHRTIRDVREPEFLPDLGIYYRNYIIKNQCDPPKLNEVIKNSEFPRIKELTFKDHIEPDNYIKSKLIDNLTTHAWDNLERETQNELIQAETLFDLSYSHSMRKMDEPADRNMHYWAAVECELHKIYDKVRIKRDDRNLYKYGNIGDYIRHFERGDLQKRCDLQILRNLRTINKIRPTAGHFLQNQRFISWGELDKARKVIISRDGVIARLANVKSN
jgi:hypothetical protein